MVPNAKPQADEFCIHRVPVSSGRSIALAVVAVDERVVGDARPEYIRRSWLSAVLSERVIRSDPAFKTIFPVDAPPIVNVFPRRDCIVEFVASSEIPLSFDAEIVATGVSDAIPVIANLADVVEVPPSRKSWVELIGVIAFPSADVVHQLVPRANKSVEHETSPLPLV